jgi:cytochrome c-type biogenesis protein CcmH
MTRVLLLVILLLAAPAPALAQPPATNVEDPRLYEVASQLRCVVCQNLSVADSPSEMAVNMKGQVRELLARGYTEEQIVKYFVLSYGQFVLLKPTFEGVNALVWLLPLLALLGGVAIVWMKLRKLEKAPVPAANPDDDPYLSRVRELVSGGKE